MLFNDTKHLNEIVLPNISDLATSPSYIRFGPPSKNSWASDFAMKKKTHCTFNTDPIVTTDIILFTAVLA